jgi:hypothetical protein
MRFIRLPHHDWQVPANPLVKGEGAVAQLLRYGCSRSRLLCCYHDAAWLGEAAVAVGAAALLGEAAAPPSFGATRKLWWHLQWRSAAVSCP